MIRIVNRICIQMGTYIFSHIHLLGRGNYWIFWLFFSSAIHLPTLWHIVCLDSFFILPLNFITRLFHFLSGGDNSRLPNTFELTLYVHAYREHPEASRLIFVKSAQTKFCHTKFSIGKRE